MAARRPARAEVVGSLLRPPRACRSGRLRAPTRFTSGPSRTRRSSASCSVSSTSASTSSPTASSAAGCSSIPSTTRWRGSATDRSAVEFRNERGETVVLTVPSIEARLRRVDSPAAREAAFLAGITDHPFKVAFPAASIFVHPFGVAPDAYDDAGRVRRARDRDRARADRRRSCGRLPVRPARLPALPLPRRPRLGRALRGGRALGRCAPRARRSPPTGRSSRDFPTT